MGRVINVLGPHGVGKTTLQKYIRDNNLSIIYEGFLIPQKEEDTLSKESYIEYESKYFERIEKEHQVIKNSKEDGFVSRSMQEVAYFLHKSGFLFSTQEIDEILHDYIKSDYLVYLDASMETLRGRISNDKQRDMVETKDWYKHDFLIYEKYYKSLPNIIVIDTNCLTTKEVYETILDRINELDGVK